MKRLLIGLVLVAAVVACLGWYLDWFTITVDKDKIQADEKKAAEKVKDVGHQVKEKVAPESK